MYYAYLLHPETKELCCVGSPQDAREFRRKGFINIPESTYIMLSSKAKIEELTKENAALLEALEESTKTLLTMAVLDNTATCTGQVKRNRKLIKELR